MLVSHASIDTPHVDWLKDLFQQTELTESHSAVSPLHDDDAGKSSARLNVGKLFNSWQELLLLFFYAAQVWA